MERLKRRRDFVATAKGRRLSRRAFSLESRERDDLRPARFGFTVTKRTAAKAVERNRIRRRLREAVRLLDPASVADGFDHVLVGRRTALTLDFAAIVADLLGALSSRAGSTGQARQAKRADEAAARSSH